jgi:glucan biosynthesis protein C
MAHWLYQVRAPCFVAEGRAMAATNTTPQRIWYIDALRASMMVLGVFLHAAEIYGAQTSFPVRDPSGHAGFDAFVHMVSSFRMPAFFLLAGMFWSHGLAHDSLKQTLRRRVLLVGLPFLVLALTLQPLQHALLLAHRRPDAPLAWETFWRTYLAPGTLGISAFSGRGFIGHLWFLPTLLLYYVMAAAALPLLRRLDTRVPAHWVLTVLREKWLYVLLTGAVLLVLRAAIRHGGGPLHGDYTKLVVYLPFFALGAIGFSQPERFAALRQLGRRDLLLLPVVAVLVLHPGLRDGMPGAASVLAQTYFTALASVALLRLYQLCLDRSWPLLQRLVDASYSIYLFHYACVLGMAMLLLPLGTLPTALKFALVSAVGLLLPYAVHRLVLARWPLARLLFNGRWARGRKAAARAQRLGPSLDGRVLPGA